MWLDIPTSISTAANHFALLLATISVKTHQGRLYKRGDCTTQTVASNDSCGLLASKCGIPPSDFTKYNSDPALCASLSPGNRVCCSPGTLPDIRPKPQSDGTCASYVVQSGDSCSAIAAVNGLKVKDIDTFNEETTWGWSGCDNIGAQLRTCLSEGSPPMPQSVDNAVCGPLKPGSRPPTDGTALADLNPCPLNACCTIWGQCGINPEFCTNETASTGNPGTAPPGRNGCISNCGTDIKNNGTGPSTPASIEYYESWNFDRPCLNMRADSVDTSKYTHYHWGFATITPALDVFINDTYNQWAKFTGLNEIKKIVSFGGWGFSTEPSTYDILRQAMSSANSEHFAANVVDFVNKNNLDGVDFDWEYPGALDIPGLPPGQESDAPNYLTFLKLLRSKLPSSKTLSIAAPASYCYLKQFPISEMADVLDYIVYMTYGLHGQWDYDKRFTQDGCPAGDCLRSHVNLTETMYALAMTTKAGVQSNKIAVGISSYGRSFGMTQSGCTGPDCSFGGPNSTASPGDCTETSGYISNAEIQLIADSAENGTEAWFDAGSDSNMLIFGDNQWVAYMDDDTRSSRTDYYKSLNFLGTVDWAVDLLHFGDDDQDPEGDADEELLPDTEPLPDCDATFNDLDALDAAAGSIPNNCKAVYTIQALLAALNTAVKNYSDLMTDGYDTKFNTYFHAVADTSGKSVHEFVNNHGNDYFSCIVSEFSLCCSGCEGKNGNGAGDPCAYCFDGDCYHWEIGPRLDMTREQSSNFSNNLQNIARRDHPHPEQVPNYKVANHTEPCPPDYSKRGSGPDNPYEQSVYWSLNSDKADKFYDALLSETGIPKDKITLGNYDRGNACAPSDEMGDGADCWALGYDYSIPTPHGYAASDVANPKDAVQKALDNTNNLVQQLSDALLDLQLNGYYGDSLELVDSVSVPVLVIINAVENMQQVEDVADEIDEAKKKALILAFLGAILFFIPVAGEVLGAVTELSGLASILAIIGAAGDAAMGVYDIVDDPDNPLLGIMSIVLAPLALGDLDKIAKAANIRRGMKDDDVLKLGGKVAAGMGTVRKVIGTCHKSS